MNRFERKFFVDPEGQAEEVRVEKGGLNNKEEEVHRMKIQNDPVNRFFKEHGFSGNSNLSYEIDVVSARGEKHNLAGKKRFDNYFDMQAFIRENPSEFIGKEVIEKEIAPYRIKYDDSVQEWRSSLSEEENERIDKDWDRRGQELSDMSNFE